MDRLSPNVLRFAFTLFLFYIFSSGPDSAVTPEQEQRFDERRIEAQLDIDHLVNRTYTSRSVLRGNTSLHIAQEDLTRAAALSREYDRDESLPLYQNVSSFPIGSWRSIRRERHGGDTSADLSRYFASSRGDLSIDLAAFPLDDAASEIRLQASFGSKNGWRWREIRLEGVQQRGTGRLFLSTDRNASHGISFTSAMAPDAATFDIIRNATVDILRDRLERDVFAPETDDYGGCDLYAYVQVHRLFGKPEDIARSEAEYRDHTGLPYNTLQPVRLSGQLFSTTCDIGVEFDAEGPPTLQVKQRALNHCLFALVAVGALTYVHGRRLASLTPSSLARLSFWSLAMQYLADGYAGVMFLCCGLINAQTILPAFAISFILIMSVALQGLRYLLLIFRMQRQLPGPQTPAPAAAAPEAQLDDAVPLGEIPITSPRRTPRNLPAAPPVVVDPPLTDAEQERRDFSTLYLWNYIALAALCMLSLAVSYLPKTPRLVSVTALCLLSTGSWWPQIYRNAIRGTRIALPISYVIQTSIIRLMPTVYLFAWPSNVFNLPPNYTTAAIVLAWAWVQVLALLAQDYLGPRCFLPRRIRDKVGIVEVHDYHNLWPILRRRAGLAPFHQQSDERGGPGADDGAQGDDDMDDDLDIDLAKDKDKRGRDEESSIGLLPLHASRASAIDRSTSGIDAALGGTGTGGSGGGGEASEFDTTCAICMSDLDLPTPSLELWRGHATTAERRLLRHRARHDAVVDAGAGTGTEASYGYSSDQKNDVATSSRALLLAARGFMVTPCLHVFHTDCLRGWLARKLRCPVCRASLPTE